MIGLDLRIFSEQGVWTWFGKCQIVVKVYYVVL